MSFRGRDYNYATSSAPYINFTGGLGTLQAGDVIVIAMVCRANYGINWPNGLTQIYRAYLGNYTFGLGWKVLDSTDTSRGNFTWPDSSTAFLVLGNAFYNVLQVTPIVDYVQTLSPGVISPASLDILQNTVLNDDLLWLSMRGTDSTTITTTFPSGYSDNFERFNSYQANGIGGIASAYKLANPLVFNTNVNGVCTLNTGAYAYGLTALIKFAKSNDATLTGTLPGAIEADVVAGGKTLIITLPSSTWIT